MDRLAAMEAFVRVMDAGSFSGAATQLRVRQSTISKTIAQLEDRLGVRLVLRSTHGLAPTEAGRNFYERAKRTIEEAEQADAAARGEATTVQGRMRVSAPVTFARLHIIPHLPAFLTEHPSLDIDVILDDGDVDLVEAGVDVALRLGNLADSALTARKIGQSRSLVVGARAYLETHGVPQSPGELAAHQIVIYDQRAGGTTWTFRQETTEVTVHVSGRLRVTAAEGVREGVLAGLGLSIGGSEWLFAPELRSGQVLSVLDDWSLPSMSLWAIFPTGRQASAKARTFVRFIEQQISEKRLDGTQTQSGATRPRLCHSQGLPAR
ncbi:MAG TPA: LysR family transcriptional regulator [Acetobacteraceae bacterium]|nr:LysR family transcriptional regulator [Acetobacteraceae bacterium]